MQSYFWENEENSYKIALQYNKPMETGILLIKKSYICEPDEELKLVVEVELYENLRI